MSRVVLTGSAYNDRDYILGLVVESGFGTDEVINTVAGWPGEPNRLPYPQMIDRADALIAIWDGKNRTTQHLIDLARNAGKPVYSVIRRIYRRNNGH